MYLRFRAQGDGGVRHPTLHAALQEDEEHVQEYPWVESIESIEKIGKVLKKY